MRRWLIALGFACVVGLGLLLVLRSQKPAPPAAPSGQGADLAPAQRAPAGPWRPGPRGPRPGSPGAGADTPAERPRPPGRSRVPQFDPYLEKLYEAAQAGNLERAAAENGIRLKGDQVRVVIRPTLGDADKVYEAVKAVGGEVVRTIDRNPSQPVLVAWVPARSLLTLAENQAVRNIHRPVGVHANEAPARPASQPAAP
jgi:hypothetical protein